MPLRRRIWMALVLPSWVLLAFIVSQIIISGSYAILEALGVSFASVSEAVLTTTLGALIYALTIVIVIAGPMVLKRKTSLQDLGLQRGPSWMDILITPLGFIAYMILSALLLAFAQQFMTFIDFDQPQDVGFDQIGQQYEYI